MREVVTSWCKNEAIYLPPVTSQRVRVRLPRLQLHPQPCVAFLRLLCICALYLSPQHMRNKRIIFSNGETKLFWPEAVNRGLTELHCFLRLCWIFLSSCLHFQLATKATRGCITAPEGMSYSFFYIFLQQRLIKAQVKPHTLPRTTVSCSSAHWVT